MKVLVVDDDIVSRMALIDLLAGFGAFEVIESEDGDAAWTLLDGGLRPVICFCDVRMPKMSGIELLQRLKASSALRELPFVLVSSASDRDTVLQAIKLGAIGYILKPFEMADAHAHLEKIFKGTIDKLAEHPEATLKRLNIGRERLIAYLVAFQHQLEAGAQELHNLLQGGDVVAVKARIDSLHTGCLTLGLWYVASRLDVVRGRQLIELEVRNALGEVASAVECQSTRVRNIVS